MTVYASRTAITRASDADHAVYSPGMRAHIHITPYGLEYRTD